MKGPTRSLTLKLILVYLAVSIVGVALFGGTMRLAFRDHFQSNVKPHLDLYVEFLLADLGKPPQLERARELTRKIPVRIHYRDGVRSWSTHAEPLPDLDDVHVWRRSRHDDRPVRFGHHEDANFAVISGDGYELIFVSPDPEEPHDALEFLPLLVIAALLSALYFLTQRLFAPLREVREAMNAFGEGDLDRRLVLARRDELGDVANSFSQMADRIQRMLESKRQLLLAISHELRSPLTRAKLATALLKETDQAAEIEVELKAMESLLSDLLETERLNADHRVLGYQCAAEECCRINQ